MGAAATLLSGTSVGRILTAVTLCGIATIFTRTPGSTQPDCYRGLPCLDRSRKRPEISLTNLLVLLALPFTVIVGSFLAYYSSQAGNSTLLYALRLLCLQFFIN